MNAIPGAWLAQLPHGGHARVQHGRERHAPQAPRHPWQSRVERRRNVQKLVVVADQLFGICSLLRSIKGSRGQLVQVNRTTGHGPIDFFNGGVEQPFPGEERSLVQSPKVATYDLKPEMSAAGIADVVAKAVEEGSFDVLVVNFANADMVGHSGKIEPTVKAVETVDACLGRIEKTVRQKGGAMLITADHGNAEMMIDPVTGGPHTAHTTNPVPFIVVAENSQQFTLKPDGSLRDISPTILAMHGILADVAPTLLFLLGLPQPKEMTGHDLRVKLSKNL